MTYPEHLGPVIEALSTIIELDPWKDPPAMPTKTAARDPFAQAATAEGNGQPAKDPFGQPATGGNFPKMGDLFGCLLLITPITIKEVPDNFNKGKTKPQLTADVAVVADNPDAEEPNKWLGKTFPNMWINNGPIVQAGATALRDGTPAILGRLWRFPVSDEKDKYADRFELEAAMAEAAANWRPGQPPLDFRYALSLEAYTDEEAQLARDFIAANKKG